MGLENTRLKMELNRMKIILKGSGADAAKGLFYRVPYEEQEFSEFTSILGTEVFTNITFEAGAFLPLDGGPEINYNGISIDSVLMVVSQIKNVITTPIQGKSGTFKEYVSDGDFQIDLKGVITSESNVYPKEKVELLQDIFSVPDSIVVTSEFLSHFSSISPSGISGISEVVVTDFNFPQEIGFRNQQSFNCRMISDTPIELSI
jgi:hypothetical protein